MEDRARLKPLAPRRFALQVTIDEETHDALRYAQELLGPEIRSGDVARVIALALQALIPQLERRRFAATDNPRPGRRTSASARQIPADVKRAVWKRDGGRCAFVSETGDRCTERTGLEYDHVEPVARGGEATVAGVRLLCAAHNQFEAERAFGSEFMRHKRLAAAEARERAMGRAAGERGG